MILRAFLLVVFANLCVVCSAVIDSPEDELRYELLKDYMPSSIPQAKTDVRLRFTVLNFDMNEKLHSLDLDLWVAMEWTDPRLTWYKGSYPEVRKLTFKRDEVWYPDISVYNNAMVKEMNHFSDARVLAMGDGSMTWVPPAHVKATCVMDMTYWPYDAHNCTVKFGSWVYDGDAVNLLLKDDVLNFNSAEMSLIDEQGGNISHGEWKLIMSTLERHETYYNCCSEPYLSITLTFVLQRNAPAFHWMVQMPCFALSLVPIAVFLMPPTSAEKVNISCLGLFMSFISLRGLSAYIDHSPSHTPLIVQFLSNQLIINISCLFCSVIILRMVRDPHGGGLPAFIRVPLVTCSSCFFVSGYRQMVTTSLMPFTRSLKGEDVEMNDNGRTTTYSVVPVSKGSECDWLLLGAVLDRICLMSLVVVFSINLINYSTVLY